MKSPRKFCHVTQIILKRWSCDQGLAFPQDKLSQLNLTRKTDFFEECSRFKFNNLGLVQVMAMIFCKSVAKGSKLKLKNVFSKIKVIKNKCLFAFGNILKRF